MSTSKNANRPDFGPTEVEVIEAAATELKMSPSAIIKQSVKDYLLRKRREADPASNVPEVYFIAEGIPPQPGDEVDQYYMQGPFKDMPTVEDYIKLTQQKAFFNYLQLEEKMGNPPELPEGTRWADPIAVFKQVRALDVTVDLEVGATLKPWAGLAEQGGAA